MKTIYFVRHGESEGNAGDFNQTAETPLTSRGREQANFIAVRCSKLPIDVIISSTMVRARETAGIIVDKIQKPIEFSDLFVERRPPVEHRGKPKNDPEAILAEEATIKNFTVPGYRFSDEENFDDLKKRAQEALGLLAGRPEEHILVVTHGLFARMMVVYAVFGDKLTSYECSQFLRVFRSENTGLTLLRLKGEGENLSWEVWSWNDHAHLG